MFSGKNSGAAQPFAPCRRFMVRRSGFDDAVVLIRTVSGRLGYVTVFSRRDVCCFSACQNVQFADDERSRRQNIEVGANAA